MTERSIAQPQSAAAHAHTRLRAHSATDALCVTALLLLTLAYALHQYDFSLPPFEDAAMLMRYAQHVAQGHGIVWNIGEQPVDGATDFLYMLALAAVVKVSASVEIAARALSLAAHLLTVALVYVAVRRLHDTPRWLALLSSAYLAIGPALGQIVAYFGNAFFVLFVTLTWMLAWTLATSDSRKREWLFAASALVMGLIRPEGVFLAAFMLLAVVWQRGLRSSRSLIVTFALTFVALGGAYFIWHWWYFSYPLPNPFYIKSGSTLHLRSLVNAAQNTLQLCLPFVPAFVIGLTRRSTRRLTIFALIPIVGFVALWALVSDEINYLMRFQYPLLPIALIAAPALLSGLRWRARPTQRYAWIACAFVLVLAYQVAQFGFANYVRDGRYDVALLLDGYADKGYTLVTTEAGLLPLYSQWRALDAWGLNDQWIAHHDLITSDYLDQHQPALIMLHRFTPSERDARALRWLAMDDVLTRYARAHGYILAASFGVQAADTHDYYVRADLSERDALVAQIRGVNYAWYFTGQPSANFAERH